MDVRSKQTSYEVHTPGKGQHCSPDSRALRPGLQSGAHCLAEGRPGQGGRRQYSRIVSNCALDRAAPSAFSLRALESRQLLRGVAGALGQYTILSQAGVKTTAVQALCDSPGGGVEAGAKVRPPRGAVQRREI